MEFFSISIISNRTGLHPQTLRTWERLGLITPHRTAGGTRRYTNEDIISLEHIRKLSAMGMSLEAIAYVLSLEARIIELENART